MEEPLYVMNLFFAAFEISSLSLAGNFDFNASQCGFLWVHLTQNLSNSSDIYVHGFPQICEVFGYYFFKYSFCPFLFSPSVTPIMHFIHLWCPTGPVGSIHFSPFLFLWVPQIAEFQLSYLQVHRFFILFKCDVELF